MLLRPFALFAVALTTAVAHAWNGTGHMVVAAVAEANLTPAARAEAKRLLAVDAARPGSDDFVSVGPWADDIRNERKETGPWHYKDLFFRPDGKPAKNKPDEVNAVTKIEEFTAVLGDKTKPDAQRAEALRFLIHFVADIHQPLHATARESDAHPSGDRGGNDYPIVAPPEFGERGPKNLHSLWDGGAGLLGYYPGDTGRYVAVAEARTLLATLPRTSLPNVGDRKPDDWAKESSDAAKKDVYATPEGAMPSPEYLARSRALAARRLAYAGYRLADLVNKALAK